MRCRFCDSQINVLDDFCPACGRSLSLLGADRHEGGADSLLKRVHAEIDREMQKADRGLVTDNGRSLMGCEKMEEPGRKSSQEAAVEAYQWKFGRLESCNEMGFRRASDQHLEIMPEDIRQIAAFVFFSAHVQSNLLYRKRAEETTLICLQSHAEVNAFATDVVADMPMVKPPLIALFGGLLNVIGIASLGLATDRTEKSVESRQALIRIIRLIGERMRQNQGLFARTEIGHIVTKLDLKPHLQDSEILRTSRSYAAAMCTVVIAHELGHIALGHTLGKQCNNKISRNQEREADSFASSVASTSPFSEYIVAGGIFWWLTLSWVEYYAPADFEIAHPQARERLMDYLRANHTQACSLGFDEESIQALLP